MATLAFRRLPCIIRLSPDKLSKFFPRWFGRFCFIRALRPAGGGFYPKPEGEKMSEKTLVRGEAMTQLENELAARAARGHVPVTMGKLSRELAAIGYRLDRRCDCCCEPRFITGPHAGESFPGISGYVVEIDTRRSACHYTARRDDNFQKLQEWRFSEKLFAIVRGRIFDI